MLPMQQQLMRQKFSHCDQKKPTLVPYLLIISGISFKPHSPDFVGYDVVHCRIDKIDLSFLIILQTYRVL